MSKHDVKVERTPIHQWTNGGDKVLIVRLVNDDGTSHGGFQWPESGKVEAPDWNTREECGGGLHGWPWGLAIGDGKEPDYGKPWLVFAADPEDVIDLGGKVKAEKGEVVCCGDWDRCLGMTAPGLAAWTQQELPVRGSASNSGAWGSASNSGVMGSASNSGDWGSASTTGNVKVEKGG